MKTDSQTFVHGKPECYDTVSLRFKKEAIDWLSSSSKRRDAEPLRNFGIFVNLLSRILKDNAGSTFSVRYSEPQLAREWQMGRTAVRGVLSKMEETGLVSLRKTPSGSVMTFPCLGGFSRQGEPFASNPEYAYRRRR